MGDDTEDATVQCLRYRETELIKKKTVRRKQNIQKKNLTDTQLILLLKNLSRQRL